MRNYELVIVLDGKVTAAKKKTFTDKLEKLVKDAKGKLGKVKDWGTKDLAYKIGKSVTGAYLIFPLELDSDKVLSISNKLNTEGDVIRFLLVKKDR